MRDLALLLLGAALAAALLRPATVCDTARAAERDAERERAARRRQLLPAVN